MNTSSFVCQHDNEPKHTANAVKAHLGRKAHSRTLSHGLASPEKDCQPI